MLWIRRQPDLRDRHRQLCLPQYLFKTVAEARHQNTPAGQHQRDRAIELGHALDAGESIPDGGHQRVHHVVVIFADGLMDLTGEMAVEAERFLFDGPDAGSRFTPVVPGARINVIARLGYAEAEHRHRKIAQTDIAQSSAATDADTGVVSALQLAVDHR